MSVNGDNAGAVSGSRPGHQTLVGISARPLIGVAVAVMIGITGGYWAMIPVEIGLGVISLCLMVAWRRSAQNPLLTTILILVGWASLGVCLIDLGLRRYPVGQIGHFTTETRRLAQLELKLVNPPRIYAPTFGQAHPMPAKQVMIARVKRVLTWKGWEEACGDILVQMSEPHPRLRLGQTIRAWGMIDRPAPSMNPGQFDWSAYYRHQRILSSFHVPHATNVVIVDESGPSWIDRWREKTRDALAEGFKPDQSLDHALLQALVLGDNDPELRDIQEQFRRTGTSHHLAISGMHIAVIGGVVFVVIRLLRLSPRLAWGVALGVVVLYGIAALPSPPVVRSVLLWLAAGLAILSRRSPDPLHLLAAVVLVMLFYQPMDLMNPGFQLSFGTVLGLVLLTGPLAESLGLHQRDPAEPVPVGWVLRTAGYIDSRLLLVVSAGLVAWLVSMPMIAFHFSQLNPWAVVGSILIGPIVFLALLSGTIKILLTMVFPDMSGVWADMAQFPAWLMRRSVDCLEQLPHGDVPLPAPTGWVIALFYFALVLATIPWIGPGIRLICRCFFVLVVLLLVAFPYQTGIARNQSSSELRITLLAVGAGQCAVVEAPSGRVILIDAGSISLADPVRRAIAPFLRHRGITRIDTILVSHANSDHFSAVAELVDAYGVREVLVPQGFVRTATDNPMLIETLAQLDRRECPPTPVRPGHMIRLGTETFLEVLWPADWDRTMSSNDHSMVLMLHHAGNRVLFTGDIENKAMRALMRFPEQIRADLLIAPHHGSAESETKQFLETVKAKQILASNDRTLSGKQRMFDRLVGSVPIFRTHENGAVTVVMERSGNYRIESHVMSLKR